MNFFGHRTVVYMASLKTTLKNIFLISRSIVGFTTIALSITTTSSPSLSAVFSTCVAGEDFYRALDYAQLGAASFCLTTIVLIALVQDVIGTSTAIRTHRYRMFLRSTLLVIIVTFTAGLLCVVASFMIQVQIRLKVFSCFSPMAKRNYCVVFTCISFSVLSLAVRLIYAVCFVY